MGGGIKGFTGNWHIYEMEMWGEDYFSEEVQAYIQINNNGLEIVKHAHSILGSIAIVQMAQNCARATVTTEAVPDFPLGDFLTVFLFCM